MIAEGERGTIEILLNTLAGQLLACAEIRGQIRQWLQFPISIDISYQTALSNARKGVR